MSNGPKPHPPVSMKSVSGRVEGEVNKECHGYTGGVKANQKHVMGNPHIVVIFWGHEYVTNSDTVSAVVQLLTDLVTGPFMNGLVQYGVGRGRVASHFLIDTDKDHPALTTLNENQALAEIISWIKAGTIANAPTLDETNLLYFLFPPTTTQLTMTNGTSGFCGYHQHWKYNRSSHNDDLFWAIVDTTDYAALTGTDFANAIAYCVSHELAEACSDRDELGYRTDTCEIGDICEKNNGSMVTDNIFTFDYQGWSVEQYWSNCDNTCIQGNQAVSVRKFLRSIGVDGNRGLRSLNTPVISLASLAAKVRSSP